jgi:hypothetical protein
MIDLTNKTVDEINGLIQKYAPLLELIKNKKEIPYLAYVLDFAIKHIETNHNEKHKDQKAWAATIVRWQYLDGYIKNESDITQTIDEFFQYVKDEFQTYAGNMVAVSPHDLETGFAFQFVHKKNGSH